MALRTMPNDIEAEKSVLGACFLSKNALNDAYENLDEDSFYDNKNLTIFKGIEALNEKKTPLDIVTLTTYLKDNNMLNDAGGVEYITSVVNFVPVASNADYYIKIVKEKSLMRKLIKTAENIASDGYNTQEDINNTLDEAERKILSIAKNRNTTEFRSIQEVMKKTEENLETLSEMKGDVTGLSTGWYDIDKITAGLHENQLIILAARPAVGKTAFALNLAVNAAINDKATVAVFNLEMGAEQLASRILSSCTDISASTTPYLSYLKALFPLSKAFRMAKFLASTIEFPIPALKKYAPFPRYFSSDSTSMNLFDVVILIAASKLVPWCAIKLAITHDYKFSNIHIKDTFFSYCRLKVL